MVHNNSLLWLKLTMRSKQALISESCLHVVCHNELDSTVYFKSVFWHQLDGGKPYFWACCYFVNISSSMPFTWHLKLPTKQVDKTRNFEKDKNSWKFRSKYKIYRSKGKVYGAQWVKGAWRGEYIDCTVSKWLPELSDVLKIKTCNLSKFVSGCWHGRVNGKGS